MIEAKEPHKKEQGVTWLFLVLAIVLAASSMYVGHILYLRHVAPHIPMEPLSLATWMWVWVTLAITNPRSITSLDIYKKLDPQWASEMSIDMLGMLIFTWAFLGLDTLLL